MVARDPEQLQNNGGTPEQDEVERALRDNQNFEKNGALGARFDTGKEKVDAPHAEGVFEHEFETRNGYTVQTTNPKKKAEAIAYGIKKQAEAEKEAEAIIKRALNENTSSQSELDPTVAEINSQRDTALGAAQSEYESGMTQADEDEQLVAQETFAGVQEVMNA